MRTSSVSSPTSVAHLGFIVIGTFALNTEGLSAACCMVNHGI